MGVDTISTPAGKRDRPIVNPGILRGFLGVALSLPSLNPFPGGRESRL
jgi:hypothetical protein